jgi:hypothetical protein
VPSEEESQNSNQRKSEVGTHSATPRLLELPPPPSYDEVVLSADSRPHSERSRTSSASEHECQRTRAHEKDSCVYEEIPESAVSAVLYTYIIDFNHTLTQ